MAPNDNKKTGIELSTTFTETWRLTTKDTERRVQAVLLGDGAWHTCMNASFRVDEEGGMASWRQNDSIIQAAHLSAIHAVRVVKPEVPGDRA